MKQFTVIRADIEAKIKHQSSFDAMERQPKRVPMGHMNVNKPKVLIGTQAADDVKVTSGILPLINSFRFSTVLTCGDTYGSSLLHCNQKDEWSCGYRNLQMILSAIIPNFPAHHPFFRLTNSDKVPSLFELQHHLQKSWSEGFDPDGAHHFSGTILGEQAQIGAVEVSSLLSYLYVDSTVMQFKPKLRSKEAITNFVWDYFSKHASTVVSSHSSHHSFSSKPTKEILRLGGYCDNNPEKHKQLTTRSSSVRDTSSSSVPPLYLQWDGHSVTIVGIEKRLIQTNHIRPSSTQTTTIAPSTYCSQQHSMPRNTLTNQNRFAQQQQQQYHHHHQKNISEEYNFLIFDPKKQLANVKAKLNIASKLHKKLDPSTALIDLRMSIKDVWQRDCQIVVVSSMPLSTQERLRNRRLVEVLHA